MNSQDLTGCIAAAVLIPGITILVFKVLGPVAAAISRKYLFGFGRRKAINIITLVAITGITVVTAAMIIVLSVFNGFQDLIEVMFSSFDPDIKIVAERGKTLDYSPELITKLQSVHGVLVVSPTVENQGMIKYEDKQHFVTIKGIRKEFTGVSPVDGAVSMGEFNLDSAGAFMGCLIGLGIAGRINTDISDRDHPVSLFAVSEKVDPLKNPEEALKEKFFFPTGYFAIQLEYDEKYVLVDFEEARELFDFKDKVTAYEIRTTNKESAEEVKAAILPLLPENHRAMTWFEQHKTLYEVMRSEKILAYLVFTLVLVLAAVNIVGSLSMIVLEKTPDIAILKSYGGNTGLIRKIFIGLGMQISLIGGTAGCVTGLVVGSIQMFFGLVPLGGGDTFLVDSYPLRLEAWDFILVFATVILFAAACSWYPASRAAARTIVAGLRG